MLALHVEGAAPQDIDLLVSGEQNQPQAFVFDAADVDGDAQLDIEVKASTKTQDPNVLINVIWVFPADFAVSLAELIAGSLTRNAEVYLDCGLEPQLLQMPQRRDAMRPGRAQRRMGPGLPGAQRDLPRSRRADLLRRQPGGLDPGE